MDIQKIHNLAGFKAHHIPLEMTDDGWVRNPEHEEDVILLEYFNRNIHEGGYSIALEGILFVRSDWTLGKDRLDSFTIIPEWEE